MAGEAETKSVENDDAFNAGFEDEGQTTTPDPDFDGTGELKDEETQVETPPEPRYAQITQEQFDDLMGKAKAFDELKGESTRKFDTAFGQLGGLKQVVERLQNQTPAGQAIQVSDDDFTELKSEFPELAEMQIKGLNRALARTKGTGSDVDVSQYTKVVEDLKAEARADALDSLNDIIENWEEAVNTPEYAAWIAAQPDDIKALEQSDKFRDAKKLLRAYKKAPKPEVKAPEAKPAPVSTRQRLLEAAVTPKSSGGNVRSAGVDPFDEGFNEG